MEHKGKAKGGAARMASMTPEQRKENARLASEAKKKRASLPKVTHEGTLKFLDIEIPCYVLENGQRVLSQRGISEAFTGTRGGGSVESGAHKLPRFLAKKDVKSFINNDLMARINQSIEFLPKAGRSAFGYEAFLLPEICEVVIDSCKHTGETDSPQHLVAETLLRGFARVGIAALIDEATGYQRDRQKNALAEILEKFVAKELQPWMRTFPAEYYENLFRLYGLPFPPDKNPSWKPQFFGHITNNVVYERLAPEILPELKTLASKAEKKAKLHQWLSSDIGHPKLREHLSSITTLLKISQTKEQFHSLVDQVHPKYGQTKTLDF